LSGSLVIQTSFLGDVILTTPLIAELAKRGPVDVLVTPTGAAALTNNPHVRAIIPYDKRSTYGSALGTWQTIKEIRVRRPYDAAYLAQGSFRSGLLAVMTGAKERIGFASSTGRVLYTKQIPYRPDRHHAERLWGLSMSDCADPPSRDQIRPRLYPSDDDRRRVDSLLPEDSAINGVGLPLLASAELIGRARAIVTNDSAPQHLASAMGTPTLTIYGPTVPEFGFGPMAERHAVAGHETLECRPCHRHGPQRCPLGHWRCMRELTPEYVSSLLTEVLNPPVPV
jgi:heptosyltransferase-2